MCHLRGEKGELSEQLSQLGSQHGALESERDSLQKRTLQLEGEVRDLTATLETRKQSERPARFQLPEQEW